MRADILAELEAIGFIKPDLGAVHREALLDMAELWRIPPAGTLFLQRKIGGLYLLATRLGARVDLSALARSFATRPGPDRGQTGA